MANLEVIGERASVNGAQTPPGAQIGYSGEISELPQARSAEDPAEKTTPEYPLPQARSAEDPARKPFSADPTDGEDIHNTVGFGVRRQVPDVRLSRRRRSAR